MGCNQSRQPPMVGAMLPQQMYESSRSGSTLGPGAATPPLEERSQWISQRSASPTRPQVAFGSQSKANKACCGNFCAVLTNRDCCEHSPAAFDSYCDLCRMRYQDRHLKEQEGKRVMARKLVEGVMDEDLFCQSCESDTNPEQGESTEDCPICLEPQRYPCALICGHSVCIDHVSRLKLCPLCRHPIDGTKERSTSDRDDLESLSDSVDSTVSFATRAEENFGIEYRRLRYEPHPFAGNYYRYNHIPPSESRVEESMRAAGPEEESQSLADSTPVYQNWSYQNQFFIDIANLDEFR